MILDSIILGDCVEVMAGFAENSIDCIVTDPPYGLNFMGKSWDKALPPKRAFIEMCRVLKPGALAFVMSSPRQDLMWRMAQLLEESGFELGQSFISWVYASGFPKAYDVSKGIDARNNRNWNSEVKDYLNQRRIEAKLSFTQVNEALGGAINGGGIASNLMGDKRFNELPTLEGYNKLKLLLKLDNRFDELIERDEAEREVIGKKEKLNSFKNGYGVGVSNYGSVDLPITAPNLDEAKQWSGWKSVSGLKPALEVVFMVQKPLSEKTIVDNVLRWGTGAMNVDACRIPIQNQEDKLEVESKNAHADFGSGIRDNHIYGGDSRSRAEQGNYDSSRGRFPANLLVSDDALNDGKNRPEAGNKRETNNAQESTGNLAYHAGLGGYTLRNTHGTVDSFSRYFDLDAWAKHNGFLNVPKAGTGEREYGLFGLGKKQEVKTHGETNPDTSGNSHNSTGQKPAKRRNIHPTVKPVELMAYLIELGCPKDGIVLDPFLGSGTTCVSAKRLGRRFIGIEIDEASHRIAVARMAAEPVKLFRN